MQLSEVLESQEQAHYDMANIFRQLGVYGKQWTVANRRNFNAEESAMVERAVMTTDPKGRPVVCVHYASGGQGYLNPSRESTAIVGQAIDLAASQLVELVREGDAPRTMIVANPAVVAQTTPVHAPGFRDNVFGQPAKPAGSLDLAPGIQPEQVPETVNQTQAQPTQQGLADMIANALATVVPAAVEAALDAREATRTKAQQAAEEVAAK